MHSRELGLILGQQLFDVDDLHYGLWDDGLELKLSNLATAQQRYTELLISTLPATPDDIRILDIGCGTGHLLSQLLERGYRADGVIPSASLSSMVKQRLDLHPGNETRLFECNFEDFPAQQYAQTYDVALFSESFQYIPMDISFTILKQILKPGGMLIICDFFTTPAHGDGHPGDRSFGGGHSLRNFYHSIQKTPFQLHRDEDITSRVSPNLELINDILLNKIKPAALTLGHYLHGNYPRIYWIATRLLRKKMARMNYKYFSGHRSKEVFERYKTYRLLTYQLAG